MSDAASKVIDLYQRHARAWAKDRGSRLMERGWLERFVDLIPDRATVLDIGCGAAEPIGRYLIGRGIAVTGIDSSPEMIAICGEAFPNGDWSVADMRTLELDRVFDGLIAWDSFFHLTHEDQRLMFPIFRRHAARGTALIFTSGPAHGVAIGSYAGEPLYHASLDPQGYRALLSENGFDVVDYVAEDPTCGGRTIWLSQVR